MTQESSLQFGRVTERAASDRKVWLFVLPAVAALVVLLVFAGLAISRTSGLETQVKQLVAANQDLQKNLDDRDRLIMNQRADVAILETPGSGVSLLTSPDPKGIASGVALYHPEHHALNAYLFGLTAPPAGQEYRLEAMVGKEAQPRSLGKVDPDAAGSAFFLSKEAPEGVSGVRLSLAPAGKPGAPTEGKPLLTGVLPGVGQTGVADQRVQARTPPAESRRGR